MRNFLLILRKMPPIPAGGLVPGNPYIRVHRGQGYHLNPLTFIGMTNEGFARFNVGLGHRMSANPAAFNFYNPGNANIPPAVVHAPAPPVAPVAPVAPAAPVAPGLWPPTGIPILDNARDIGEVYDPPGGDPLINIRNWDIIPTGSRVYVISGPHVGNSGRFRYTYLAEDIKQIFNTQRAVRGLNCQLRVPDNNVEIGTANMLRPGGYLIERAIFMGTKNNDYGFSMRQLFNEGGRRRTKRSKHSKRSKRSKKTRRNNI